MKVYTKEELAEQDWLDLRYTEVTYRHRRGVRHEKNEVREEFLDRKSKGEVLGVKELEAGDAS